MHLQSIVEVVALLPYLPDESDGLLLHHCVDRSDLVFEIIVGAEQGILEQHLDVHQHVVEAVHGLQEFALELVDQHGFVVEVLQLSELVLLGSL
eukprot:CAMPEP_0170485142 /NCGR_PEP_ID=MMETSP0208-20121228/4469_1 /TAXON_ID=197538 /ORGANISM="Strombidium inclinatum, Strain S3" /LENGTH=93 /DNA_ID=CAMNT_0010758697 /DNA_START=285 /DNA_END=566 /DNA_ORIENTATION=-